MKNEILERLKYAICGVRLIGDADAEQIAKNILKVLRDELLRMQNNLDGKDYYSTIDFINWILDYE